MDKDFRRLKRSELVEIIYQQRIHADQVEADNQALKGRLAEMKQRYSAQRTQALQENEVPVRSEDMERIGQAMQNLNATLMGMEREAKDQYKARIAQLEWECKTLQDRLNTRLQIQQKAGTLAEAVVGLNDVFASAQRAADQYVEQITAQSGSAEAIVQRARMEADRILGEAEEKARLWMQATEMDIRNRQVRFQMQYGQLPYGQEMPRKAIG